MMADDTAAIIEQLGLGPVDVVGHSDGAVLALILARDHPQMIRHLVISGANIRVDLSPEETQRAHWSPQQLAAHLRQVADSLPPWFLPDYSKVGPDGPDHRMTLLAKSYDMWLQPVVIEPADLKKISIPSTRHGRRPRPFLRREKCRDIPRFAERATHHCAGEQPRSSAPAASHAPEEVVGHVDRLERSLLFRHFRLEQGPISVIYRASAPWASRDQIDAFMAKRVVSLFEAASPGGARRKRANPFAPGGGRSKGQCAGNPVSNRAPGLLAASSWCQVA